ncbi:formate--tetrahydrofolate ligase [Myxococcota bacterium]|nr:formate--tetrahydrofolate ligase [Myxococcota bacterium]
MSLLPISEIAARAGFHADDVEPYGRFKAKIALTAGARRADRPRGKYIDVTAVTPTPAGEGKTVTSIGLTLGLNRIGRNVMLCLRQPSMGPTFGVKGGAAGGGLATIEPRVDINLHLNGDMHAVGAAHNLLAAAVDASLFHGNPLKLDPKQIMLRRVVDVNDRALRHIEINAGDDKNPIPRSAGFDVTPASEVMALLALAEDAADLRARLGRIVVGFTPEGEPVTAEQLKVAGAMAAILKDALLPNLVQTREGSACLIHAGPFANIAHGNNSIIADRIALQYGDYVVTESGFASDLGMEKFMDIKCRQSGLVPDCVVVVATIRALKMHGGAGTTTIGKALPESLTREDLPALERGCANLGRHLANVAAFGVPAVVAINGFPTDTPAEFELVRDFARRHGAVDAVPSLVFAQGGEGGMALAEAVVKACEQPKDFKLLYPDEASVEDKMTAIAKAMYGADGIEISELAAQKIAHFTKLGWGRLPICMAKTQMSLSHDPKLLNAPTGFKIPVRDIRASVGAGFLYALCGSMLTMPGLPSHPAFENVDVDAETGVVRGL